MPERRLRFDPTTPWDGAFPYDAVSRLGLTPESTTTQVLDAYYAMTPEQTADPVLNDAWETLTNAKSRLVVDFFCLDLPDPPDPAPGMRPELLAFALAAAIDPGLPDPAFPDVSPDLPATLDADPAPFVEEAVR